MDELTNALDSAADGAFAVDEELKIVYANRAAHQMLGFSLDEGLYTHCYQMLQARDEQQRLICHERCRVAKKILSGAPVTNFDLELPSKSADSRWINVSVFRYADEHEVKPYIIHLFRDITQQKMEVRLVERLVEVAKNYHNIRPDLLSSHKKARHVEDLTPREVEVLGLLAKGNSTREIGQELSISVNTTRNHIQNVLRKLNVHTRLEAVIYAIDHDFVDQSD